MADCDTPLRAFAHDVEWTGSKKQREALRAKFNGHCAYCGCVLDKMHADHMKPVTRITRDPCGRPLPSSECRIINPENNVVSNMMPACGPCNLHKGGYSLEGWRDIIQRSAQIIAKQTSTFRAGVRFGVIAVHEMPVRFYFETLQDGHCHYCVDESGQSVYPMYGVAPHECYWRKGPEFTIGQSTLLPLEQWEPGFVPEILDGETWDDFQYPSACGVYYCPKCQRGKFKAAWSALVARIGEPPNPHPEHVGEKP